MKDKKTDQPPTDNSPFMQEVKQIDQASLAEKSVEEPEKKDPSIADGPETVDYSFFRLLNPLKGSRGGKTTLS